MKFTSKFIFFFSFLLFLVTISVFAQDSDTKLLQLRNQFALKYFQPESHFALAQYYLQKGNKTQAFYILEYARRYRFSEKEFDDAFTIFFGAFTQKPNQSAENEFKKAYDLLKQNKSDEAESAFVKAAELDPNFEPIQTWTGRFFFKTREDNNKALKYYFNAYFLYPHAYETEYVESRIRQITLQNANAEFENLKKQGQSLTKITTNENPLVVSKALEEMEKQWKPEYLQPFLDCMSNDDSFIRWFALMSIFKNERSNFDTILPTLLNNSDLRKRGLAAYLLIEFWQEKGFAELKKMLSEKNELIRFDAVSALVLSGGQKGIKILRLHQKSETSPYLASLLAKALKEKKP